MKIMFWLGVFLALVCWSDCQSSTLLLNVFEIDSIENVKLVCDVSSADNLTRWTYLSGSTGTSLMSFQNGVCTVSPSDSFLSDSSRYSYTCNSRVYQVTILSFQGRTLNNDILTCRDALQPDGTGSTWIIKTIAANGTCSYCEPTITFDVVEVKEGENITITCRVSSDVTLINWNVNFGSNTAAMSVQNGTCLTSPSPTFLDNTTEYIYTCNKTVYQVTRLNVIRSHHNDMYMCTPPSHLEGNGSNWIIKVKAPVISVTMTPTYYMVDIVENTAVEFTCTTSTARPAASVYWYRHPNGKVHNKTQITENVTTAADYNDLKVIKSTIRIVPTRQDNNTKIFCAANNTVNTTLVEPDSKRLLNVLYKADDPYITQGDKYRVIENSIVTLSCSAKGGNPTPTLSWSFTNFTSTNQSTIISNGNVTTTVTWNVSRTHNGTCTCTSQQTMLYDENIDVALIVLYKPDSPTQFTHIGDHTTISSIHLQWKPGFDGGLAQTFYIKYKRSSDIVWNYLNVSDNGEETMDLSFTGLTENTQYKFVILASNEKGNSSESSVLIASTKAIYKANLGPLIGGIAGGVTGYILLVIVIIVLIRRYPVFKGTGANKAEIRRSVSDDSDEGDDLVDNPMYESADNMASAASTSSELSSQQKQPNRPSVTDNGDVYAVVKKNQDSKGHSKSGSGMDRLRDGDEYESVEVNNVPSTEGVGIELSIVKATATETELNSVNKDGLMYADIVFNDKQPGEKIVIISDDPTQYDIVDFSKKAEHLPDSIYENAK